MPIDLASPKRRKQREIERAWSPEVRRAALNELREMVLWHTRIRLRGNFLHGLRAQQGPSKGERFTLKSPNHLYVLASEAWSGEGYGFFLTNLHIDPDKPGSPDAAKEVLRPTFEPRKPWKRRAWEFEASSVAGPWLRKRVLDETLSRAESWVLDIAADRTAEAELEEALWHLDLEQIFTSTLPPLQDAIVRRRYLNYSIQEIARDLGVSEGTIKRSLHEARRNPRLVEELWRLSNG